MPLSSIPAAISPVTPDCPVEVFQWGGAQGHHPDQQPHAHPFDEMLLFNQGGGSHWIDGVQHPVEGASIHFVRVGTKHQLAREPQAEGGTVLFLRDYIALEPALPFKQLFFLESNPVLRLNRADFAELWMIYKQLLREAKAEQRFYRKQSILSWLNALLVKVAEHYRQAYPAPQETTHSAPQRLAQAFQQLVAQHARQEKTVAFYARQLFVTPKYLYEISQKQLGKSPQALIAAQLCTEAVQALHTQPDAVKQVAAELGFPDPAYFSRFLKKHTGKSPLEWR